MPTDHVDCFNISLETLIDITSMSIELQSHKTTTLHINILSQTGWMCTLLFGPSHPCIDMNWCCAEVIHTDLSPQIMYIHTFMLIHRHIYMLIGTIHHCKVQTKFHMKIWFPSVDEQSLSRSNLSDKSRSHLSLIETRNLSIVLSKWALPYIILLLLTFSCIKDSKTVVIFLWHVQRTLYAIECDHQDGSFSNDSCFSLSLSLKCYSIKVLLKMRANLPHLRTTELKRISFLVTGWSSTTSYHTMSCTTSYNVSFEFV